MASKHQNTANTSITYRLFEHLKELRRPTQQPLSLNKSKVQLTTYLIKENIQNIQLCSTADLKDINREILFKAQLCKQIKSMKQGGVRQNGAELERCQRMEKWEEKKPNT